MPYTTDRFAVGIGPEDAVRLVLRINGEDRGGEGDDLSDSACRDLAAWADEGRLPYGWTDAMVYAFTLAFSGGTIPGDVAD